MRCNDIFLRKKKLLCLEVLKGMKLKQATLFKCFKINK